MCYQSEGSTKCKGQVHKTVHGYCIFVYSLLQIVCINIPGVVRVVSSSVSIDTAAFAEILEGIVVTLPHNL